MIISGIQKLSLLDYPDKTCATVFTYGCNFRCPFCHNSLFVTEKKPHQIIQEEEVFAFLEQRQGLLDAVTVSGGEPLLQKDIISFIDKVKEMGFLVKLDTNGNLPTALEEVINHVDFVAMDIKNSPNKYAQTAGVTAVDFDAICRSTRIIRESGKKYEFRTTAVKEFHTIEDIDDIAHWLSGSARYTLQNYKDSDMVIGENLHSVSHDWLLMAKQAAEPEFDEVIIKD